VPRADRLVLGRDPLVPRRPLDADERVPGPEPRQLAADEPDEADDADRADGTDGGDWCDGPGGPLAEPDDAAAAAIPQTLQ
jgi:hypothetical protein